jgi:hypothetical protein
VRSCPRASTRDPLKGAVLRRRPVTTRNSLARGTISSGDEMADDRQQALKIASYPRVGRNQGADDLGRASARLTPLSQELRVSRVHFARPHHDPGVARARRDPPEDRSLVESAWGRCRDCSRSISPGCSPDPDRRTGSNCSTSPRYRSPDTVTAATRSPTPGLCQAELSAAGSPRRLPLGMVG